MKNSSNDFPALYANLEKVRKCWVCFRRILGREEADVFTSRIIYHVVIQTLLLCVLVTFLFTVPMFGSPRGIAHGVF